MSSHTHTGNATIDANPGDFCTLQMPGCSLQDANFTYIPSLAGNLTYLIIFGVLIIAQIGLGVFYRTWGFLVGMVFGVGLELVGYIGRVQLHYNPFPFDPFLEYLVCLTIAPAFLSAAIYLCLGRIIVIYGENISRLRPSTYTLIFVTCDFISLLLQAAGGAITATANKDQQSLSQTGVNVMIAGLSSQVVSLFIFMVLCGEFAWRVYVTPARLNENFTYLRSTSMWKGMLGALALATITIFIRCCFRVAELNAGFNGSLANNQTLFMIFEGPMIIIAVGVLTVFHPGVSFQGNWNAGNWSFKKGNKKPGPSADKWELLEEGRR